MDQELNKQSLIILSDGNRIPIMGLGTYGLTESIQISQAITKLGYRHLDTGSYYENEQIVGEGIQEALKEGLKREEIFITGKVWPTDMHRIEESLDNTLQKLQINYIDLFLLHWPISVKKDEQNQYQLVNIPLHQKWTIMEDLVKKGKVKSIGLSNHNVQIIIDLLSYAQIKPVCNQIELHPFNNQADMIHFLKDNNIVPIAFYPIIKKNQKESFENPLIIELSQKHKKTSAQILLRWGLQRGHVVIPKSQHFERQLENISIFDFQLDQEDMQKINNLNLNQRYANYYDFVKGYNIFA